MKYFFNGIRWVTRTLAETHLSQYQTRCSAILLSVALITVACGAATAQSAGGIKPTPLGINMTLTGELAGQKIHEYTVTAKSGEYLHVVLEQRGIDLVLTLFSPDGVLITSQDSPNGTTGLEELVAIAPKDGVFTIQVKALEDAPAGRYSILLKEKHTATAAEISSLRQREELSNAQQIENQWFQLYSKGKYAEAIPLAEKVLAIRERVHGKDHGDVGTSLNSLALLNQNAGMFSRAEELFKRALRIQTAIYGENDPNLAIEYGNIGTLYYETGEYVKAEQHLTKALELREKGFGKLHLDVALSVYNLAKLYEAIGDFIRAEEFGERALALYRQLRPKDHPDIGRSLTQLAASYRLRGDMNRAESLLKQTIAIDQAYYGKKHISVTLPMSDLALVYQLKREWQKAVELYGDVLEIYETTVGKDHPLVAVTLANLAGLFDSMDDRVHAEQLIRGALAIQEKLYGADSPGTANALSTLASIYEKQGKFAEAEATMKKVLFIWESSLGPKHPNVAVICQNLALLYAARLNDLPKAIQFAKRTAEINQYNAKLILTIGSESQKRAYLASRFYDVDLLVSLSVKNARDNPEASVLALTGILQRKGRILDTMADEMGLLRQRSSVEDRRVLDDISDTRSKLARLVISNSKGLPAEARNAEIATLEQKLENLESTVSKLNNDIRNNIKPASLEAVQQALPKDAALVEFVSYKVFDMQNARISGESYAAFIVRPDRVVPQIVDLGMIEGIDRDVVRWRRSLNDPDSTDVRAAGRSLDAKIFQPVRKLLGSSVRHIFISPDSSLNLVPFAALVDEKGKYVVENHLITYLSSGRDLIRWQTPSRNARSSVIVSNPRFDMTQGVSPSDDSNKNRRSVDFAARSYTSLPGTAIEGEEIKIILNKADLLTDMDATEGALKKVSKPTILHIATHGFFLPSQKSGGLENPLLRSGLILAGVNQRKSGSDDDGVLTSLEVAGMELYGTKLVVLSACDTGLGDVVNSEGVYGLRRAFVLAGSEAQVTSLWKVSDAATRVFMIDYYKRLQANAGRAAALQQVQIAMVNGKLKGDLPAKPNEFPITSANSGTRPLYSHPYYWAAFLQSGAATSITEISRPATSMYR